MQISGIALVQIAQSTHFFYIAVHNDFFFLKILSLNLPLYENMLIFFQTFTICSESLCTVKGDFKDQQKKKANSFSNKQYLVVDDRNFKSLLVT